MVVGRSAGGGRAPADVRCPFRFASLPLLECHSPNLLPYCSHWPWCAQMPVLHQQRSPTTSRQPSLQAQQVSARMPQLNKWTLSVEFGVLCFLLFGLRRPRRCRRWFSRRRTRTPRRTTKWQWHTAQVNSLLQTLVLALLDRRSGIEAMELKHAAETRLDGKRASISHAGGSPAHQAAMAAAAAAAGVPLPASPGGSAGTGTTGTGTTGTGTTGTTGAGSPAPADGATFSAGSDAPHGSRFCVQFLASGSSAFV